MAEDLQQFKDVVRLQAELESEAPNGLAEQKTWLVALFRSNATDAAAGGFQAGASSFEGGSFSGGWRGLTSTQRAYVLSWAIREITLEIEAEDADEMIPVPTAVLMPRVVCAPR
jgi:hypothetical protein